MCLLDIWTSLEKHLFQSFVNFIIRVWFLLGCSSLCMCACVLNRFSCVQLCNPADCSLPGCSVHGILQARTLEWVAMPSSRGSSQPRDQTYLCYVSCIGSRFFTTSATYSSLYILDINLLSDMTLKYFLLFHRFPFTLLHWCFYFEVIQIYLFFFSYYLWVSEWDLPYMYSKIILVFFCWNKEKGLPGHPVVKILHFQCRNHGLDPWLKN